MPDLVLMRLPAAPDGSDVRVLLGLAAGGMAHFELVPGRVSKAVMRFTVEEIWYIVAGRGEMWRKFAEGETIDTLEPGVCLTLPLGMYFQFRCLGEEPLAAVAVTMPPWPGEGEAILVEGVWRLWNDRGRRQLPAAVARRSRAAGRSRSVTASIVASSASSSMGFAATAEKPASRCLA